jgi:WD40 repeat protein
MICLKVLEGRRKQVRSVAATDDGKRAVSGRDNGTVEVWDLERETCIKVLKPLPCIDITQIDLSEAVIDTEEDREILRQNGALV